MNQAENASDGAFTELLDYLRRARGFDFTSYKRASLARRVERRMQRVGVETFRDYVDYLEVHPTEFPELFNSVLINVTAFFRDPASWDYVAKEIVPQIVAGKDSTDPIRIWSAGCASGEEAFTLAMMMTEALGAEEFRSRVKIYASNVDEGALAKARQATYSAAEVEGVPKALLAKYFEVTGGRYVFAKDLRRSVIFGRHDLVQDAPISRIDLLVCRNTLMYFNAETQAKIIARFHFALADDGFLFLGKAEMLLNHGDTFRPVDLRRRVFAKVGTAAKDRLLVMAHAETVEPPLATVPNDLRDLAFEADSRASVVIDRDGRLVLANQAARSLFGLTARDLGRAVQELECFYKPVELKPLLAELHADGRAVDVREIDWPIRGGERRSVEIHVSPLVAGSEIIGAKVTYSETTRETVAQEDLLRLREELATTREELETTNEELESTNEELETTNEELQSTNEELETMNEELQSTNEELRTMNDEIIRRGEEVGQLNAFLESILKGLGSAVVVTDRDLHIQVWNGQAENLWGLRADEVADKPLLNLDIGFPVERLRVPIRTALGDPKFHHEEVVEATNRRGRKITCKYACSALVGIDQGVRGIILLMEESDGGKLG